MQVVYLDFSKAALNVAKARAEVNPTKLRERLRKKMFTFGHFPLSIKKMINDLSFY